MPIPPHTRDREREKIIDMHLTSMSNNRLDRLADGGCSKIPYKHVLIIPNRTKQVLMPQMPSHILHNTFMDLTNKQTNTIE